MRTKTFVYIYLGLIVLGVLLGLASIVLKIYAVIAYGDVPLSECPTWVAWILSNE